MIGFSPLDTAQFVLAHLLECHFCCCLWMVGCSFWDDKFNTSRNKEMCGAGAQVLTFEKAEMWDGGGGSKTMRTSDTRFGMVTTLLQYIYRSSSVYPFSDQSMLSFLQTFSFSMLHGIVSWIGMLHYDPAAGSQEPPLPDTETPFKFVRKIPQAARRNGWWFTFSGENAPYCGIFLWSLWVARLMESSLAVGRRL